jgi:sec-independent protein translocase protein TatC
MLANLLSKNNRPDPGYDEDFFKDSRMSFGDHLDELRTRMWRAIMGLAFCLLIGFVLDGIGDRLHQPWIGIGIPALRIIRAPVEEQVTEFYRQRNEEAKKRLAEARREGGDARIKRTMELPAKIRSDQFPGLFNDPNVKEIECTIVVTSSEITIAAQEGAENADVGKRLQGMSVMEGFMVYFKVSLLCGVILACPWIFYQMWAFVGAGLYPHEKKLVHVYLPFSVLLFVGGIVLCQAVVMSQAVEALLGFYKWIDVDPELRLNEWLSFAILMPLVFGIAFQTPLVMLFFNRIGVLTWQSYLAKWRYTTFGMVLITMLICPSMDIVSWLCLFIPTYSLFLVGILLCYLMPPPSQLDDDAEEEEVSV